IAASVSMSFRFPVSRNSFMVPPPGPQTRSWLGVHGIRQLADAFDFDGDDIPRSERTHGGGWTGRNDIARIERHHERYVFDEQIDRKDQLIGRRSLPARAVDPPFDGTHRVVGTAHDAWTDGAERVEALRARVLDFLALNVAGRDVVDRGN